MNLREALKEAAKLGCRVYTARRTGEMFVWPKNGKPIRVNKRRKDSPKVLESLIRQLNQVYP